MTSSLREFRRTDRARLIRTQQATQSALNSLSDAIVICDPTGEVELSNDAAQLLFASSRGRPLNRPETTG